MFPFEPIGTYSRRVIFVFTQKPAAGNKLEYGYDFQLATQDNDG